MDAATRSELLATWQAWDRQPKDRATTDRRLAAEQVTAATPGWDFCGLHNTLIAARRLGHDHTTALDLTVEVYEAGEAPAW